MSNVFSRLRLLSHGLAVLPTDINGRPDGVDYDPFLHLNEMRAYRSVRNAINGIWSGREHHLASEYEADIFIVLEGQARALSLREGYLIVPDEVLQDLRGGKEVSRNQVMTIDFVITLPPRNTWGPLRYLGVKSQEVVS